MQTAATPSAAARVEFHIPQRPYSPIDAHNRAAAALGSPRYAALASHADYNGHHVTLSWNSYRGYYVAEYMWAGRVVLGRGSFETCLRAVLAEHARGALGSSATICVRADDEAALAMVRATPGVVEGSIWKYDDVTGIKQLDRGGWWTWRHQVAHESARDSAAPGFSFLIFDWALCEAAEDRAAYEAVLKAKYGRAYQ